MITLPWYSLYHGIHFTVVAFEPSATHPLTHLLTCSLSHSLTLTHPLTHSRTPSLARSLTPSLAYSLPHSPIHSLTLILILTQLRSWTVDKRYSELALLHDQLEESYPGTGMQVAVRYQLPVK